MAREQFEKLKVGDKVKHPSGGIGVVTEKNSGTYTVKDKGFDQGDGMCEVSFAWNEGEPWFPTGEIADIIKQQPPFIFHCHNDIGKWYCELCPNYKTCKIKKQ